MKYVIEFSQDFTNIDRFRVEKFEFSSDDTVNDAFIPFLEQGCFQSHRAGNVFDNIKERGQ